MGLRCHLLGHVLPFLWNKNSILYVYRVSNSPTLPPHGPVLIGPGNAAAREIKGRSGVLFPISELGGSGAECQRGIRACLGHRRWVTGKAKRPDC